MILRTNEKNKGRRNMDRKLESKANNIQKAAHYDETLSPGKANQLYNEWIVLSSNEFGFSI